MNNFYIYAHYTLNTNELFYIGKGKDNRAYCSKGRNKYWKNIVKKYGYKVKILINNLSEESALIQEFLGIKELKPKANLTKGGVGGNTAAFFCSKKLKIKRQKCSIKRKKFWENKTDSEKKEILKKCHQAVAKMWANMSPEEKSKEQTRRASFKKLKAVKCLNNGKVYISAKHAGKDLNLTHIRSIQRVAKGNRAHYKNYKFEYVTSE